MRGRTERQSEMLFGVTADALVPSDPPIPVALANDDFGRGCGARLRLAPRPLSSYWRGDGAVRAGSSVTVRSPRPVDAVAGAKGWLRHVG